MPVMQDMQRNPIIRGNSPSRLNRTDTLSADEAPQTQKRHGNEDVDQGKTAIIDLADEYRRRCHGDHQDDENDAQHPMR